MPRRCSAGRPVAVPVLVAVGGDSPSHVHRAADALTSILAKGETQTLPGQTHDVAPELLASVLVEFLGPEVDGR